MGRKYFGTDGVRGQVGQHPMTVEFALRLASAAARVLAPEGGTALVGKDTRLSGYMFEAALEAGFVAAGVDVQLIGPLPTPGIAYMTKKFRCSFGVVISASHNLYEDNGIKFFDAHGSKLSDELEEAIESYLDEPALTRESIHLGRAVRVDKSRVVYQEFCASVLPRGLDLTGLKIVVDCANGASYQVAPDALWELGADVVAIGVNPDGVNINEQCGSTHPELLQETVVASGADIGLALDGDADRIIVVDEKGRITDGDQLMALIALDFQRRGALQGDLVATVMSNLGLERRLAESGIGMVRAPVGDRYVLEMMRQRGCNLGGEQSGHLILADYATTGDGLVAGLQVLAALVESGKPASEVLNQFEPVPQLLKNVRFNGGAPLERESVQKRIAEAEAELSGRGRLLIRKSGTEPLIRVMAEADDKALIERIVDDICEAVRSAA